MWGAWSSGIHHLASGHDRFVKKWIFEPVGGYQIDLSPENYLEFLDHIHPIPPAMRLGAIEANKYVNVAAGSEIILQD